MNAVRGSASNPRTHRASFVNAFFQDLAFDIFSVIHQLRVIFRLIQLANIGVNAKLTEHAFHTESARFIGHNRHDTST